MLVERVVFEIPIALSPPTLELARRQSLYEFAPQVAGFRFVSCMARLSGVLLRLDLVAADDVEIVDRRHRQAERRDQHAPGQQRACRHRVAQRHAMAMHHQAKTTGDFAGFSADC